MRPREDISMDGSRIEGSHKAWNSLQRAQPSGIETYELLAFDAFHRRNLRIGTSRVQNGRSVNFSAFISSAQSSHHVDLVNHTAKLFNELYEKEPLVSKKKLTVLPTLPRVDVKEMFGLVESSHSVTFGGFIEAKAEPSDQDLDNALFEEIDAAAESEVDQMRLIESLDVNESQLSVMMARSTISSSSSSASRTVGAVPFADSLSPALKMSLASTSTANVQSKKRKEQADGTSDKPGYIDDSTPDPKRKRFAGPPSPDTLALGYSSILSPEPDFIELDQVINPRSGVSTAALRFCIFYINFLQIISRIPCQIAHLPPKAICLMLSLSTTLPFQVRCQPVVPIYMLFSDSRHHVQHQQQAAQRQTL